MKGQYLAVESALTLSLGLITVLGVVTIADSYSSQVYDTTDGFEAKIVQAEVVEKMNNLKVVNGGSHTNINLPNQLSNREYLVTGGEKLTVEVEGKEYSTELHSEYNLSGSGSGDIKLTQSDGEFIISDR